MSTRTQRIASTLLLSLAFSGLAHAQKSIVVSKPTKTGTDHVTIRYKVNGDAQTHTVAPSVDIPAGTSAADKAKLVRDAINGQDPNVTASIPAGNSNKVNITGPNGVTIRSANLSGSSGEARDGLASAGLLPTTFSFSLEGKFEFVDGTGDSSTLLLGTDRGEVLLHLEAFDSTGAAMMQAAEELADFGIPVVMTDDLVLKFAVDAELDGTVLFGCTDMGIMSHAGLADMEADGAPGFEPQLEPWQS